MTLNECKQAAPPLRMMGEYQLIVGTPDECRLITGVFGSFSAPQQFNGEPVIAARAFAPTNYARQQQGEWYTPGSDE